MSVYRLQQLLSPRSIALIGASPREGSLGRVVLRNLKDGGFRGDIHLVNPRYKNIDDIEVVGSLNDLKTAPDLVIIATPAATVPALVAQAGRSGVATAIILTAGLGSWTGLARRENRKRRACAWPAAGRAELSRRHRSGGEAQCKLYVRDAAGR